MMEKPQKKRKNSLSQKVNEQVEKIVYQVMTNEGLEQTVAIAVQKALINLVKRYWLLGAVAVIALLFVQSIFLSLVLIKFY
jgi:hypothetical protein